MSQRKGCTAKVHRAAIVILVGIGILIGLFVVWPVLARVHADRQYRAMQKRLGTSLDPVVVLGKELAADIDKGKRLTVEQVEARIAGYSDKIRRERRVYYLYFVVDHFLLGRGGSYIRATYSADGILEEAAWDTSEEFTADGGPAD